MELLQIVSYTVANVVNAISDVLDVDVIAVDQRLNSICCTYKYMNEKSIHIKKNSVLSSAIHHKKTISIMDIHQRNKCISCQYLSICLIKGIIAVPIEYKSDIVGAIGLLFLQGRDQSKYLKDREGVINFAERMAELLSSKLASVKQLEELESYNSDVDYIISHLNEGVVRLDKKNRITFYNQTFVDNFGLRGDLTGLYIHSLMEHLSLFELIQTQKEIVNEPFSLKNSRANFNGMVSCHPNYIHGKYKGAIIRFKKLDGLDKVMSQFLPTNRCCQFEDLIDLSIEHIVREAKKFALLNSPLLITGEEGVGKSSLAEAIHDYSWRKRAHCLKCHCAFTSEEESLSQLFGVTRYKTIGPGNFQLAHKGTVVLESVEKLPFSLQETLCNYLDTGTIQLKDSHLKELDVKIVMTSCYSLKELQREKLLLPRLTKNLSAYTLPLPPLKERGLPFFQEFLYSCCRKYPNYDLSTFEDNSFVRNLFDHKWKKNLSGIKRFLDRLAYQSQGKRVKKSTILNALYQERLIEAGNVEIKPLEEYEKEIIQNALETYRGVVKRNDIVAQKLQIGRATLYRKIRIYGL